MVPHNLKNKKMDTKNFLVLRKETPNLLIYEQTQKGTLKEILRSLAKNYKDSFDFEEIQKLLRLNKRGLPKKSYFIFIVKIKYEKKKKNKSIYYLINCEKKAIN